ncbi:MAG: glycosyltransferase family 4 protein [Burkholderiales bacterium]|nr:glycosyltransferase family 4 protein [Burkholderiales bacterium]
MGIFLFSCAVSVAIIGLLLISKLAWRIAVDVPNDRSLHSRPIPRIGGWGVIPAAIVASLSFGAVDWPLAGSSLLLFIVSYLDDRVGLPILIRFTAHAAVSIAWVVFGPASLPLLLGGIAVFAIIWSINLYNFMDGANGLAGGMGLIGFLAYAVGAASHDMASLTLWSIALAGASAGFLLFNFSSARVFLGDCGSVPLGFFVGALGLWGWSAGAWPAWFPFLVFGSFFLDATVTLVRRLIDGERFWRAHAEHYYQRLIRSGWSHPRTALCEYVLMAVSAGLATAMLNWSVPAQYAGLATAAGVFVVLAIFVDRRWLKFQRQAGKV